MKRNIIFAAVFLLLPIAAITGRAQARPGTTAAPMAPSTAAVNVSVPVTKIALVNTEFFRDEKTGIKRYVNAVKSVDREFQPATAELNSLQTRIKVIVDEIGKLSDGSPSLRPKQDEVERLQNDLKVKRGKAADDYAKRYEIVVGPISADVAKALDQYSSKHGLTMILDISKLAPAILTVNPGMDVTDAFIAEFNSRNP